YQARLALEAAKGDLAHAQGDVSQAIKCYEQAVAAADDAASALTHEQDNGLTTIDVLLDAHRRRAEVKTSLNRLKEELSTKQKVDGNTEPQSTSKPAAASEGPTLFGQITDTEGKPVTNV